MLPEKQKKHGMIFMSQSAIILFWNPKQRYCFTWHRRWRLGVTPEWNITLV